MSSTGGDHVLPAAAPAAGRTRTMAVAAGVVALSAAFLALLVLRPAGLVVPVSDVATTAAAIAATCCAAATARRCLGSLRTFWWLLAAACGSWAAGEVVWTWYEVVRRVEVPYPSLADLGYLAGTPLAVVAFAAHPAARYGRGHRVLPLLDAVAVACALLLTSWTFVLAPLWNVTGGRSLGDLVAVAYPFGDVVVLAMVVLAVTRSPRGDGPAVTFLLGGLTLMAVSDSAYTYLAQLGRYDSGGLIDTGWFTSYLALAAAALVERPERDVGVAQAPPASPARAALPFLPVLAALGVVAVAVPRGHVLDQAAWGITVTLCSVVLLRAVLDQATQARRHRGRRSASSRPAPKPVGDATLGALALQIVAAQAPTAQERTARVSSSLVLTLSALAGSIAVWDLSLLMRH